jgi:hypothetical protein
MLIALHIFSCVSKRESISEREREREREEKERERRISS